MMLVPSLLYATLALILSTVHIHILYIKIGGKSLKICTNFFLVIRLANLLAIGTSVCFI